MTHDLYKSNNRFINMLTRKNAEFKWTEQEEQALNSGIEAMLGRRVVNEDSFIKLYIIESATR